CHVLQPSAEACGEIELVDIGMPPDALRQHQPCSLIDYLQVRRWLPYRPWSGDTSKGSFGSVLVIAGSEGMTGAAVLAAKSALRAGAGLVYLAIPENLNLAIEASATEVITLPM